MYTTLLFAGKMNRLRKQPTSDGTQLTEDEIANRVLGTRSECILGLSPGPKPPKSQSSQSKAKLQEALRESTRQQEQLAARVKALEAACGADSEALEKCNKLLESLVTAGFLPPTFTFW